jgi:hypothetical protein
MFSRKESCQVLIAPSHRGDDLGIVVALWCRLNQGDGGPCVTRRIHLLLLVVSMTTWTACDEKLSTLAGPSPDLMPTFSSIQRDIFESTDVAGRIACTQCHTNVGKSPSGGFILLHDLAYDQLVNVHAREKSGAIRVIPGDPDDSYLVQKLEGAPGIVGRRMPFSGPPYLTDGQILIIRRWIAIGAPRN